MKYKDLTVNIRLHFNKQKIITKNWFQIYKKVSIMKIDFKEYTKYEYKDFRFCICNFLNVNL